MRVENELGVSVITLSWHRKRSEGRLPIYRAEVRVLVGAEDLGDDDTLLVACLAWHLRTTGDIAHVETCGVQTRSGRYMYSRVAYDARRRGSTVGLPLARL